MSNIYKENKRTGKRNVIEIVEGRDVSTYTEKIQQFASSLSVNEQEKCGKGGGAKFLEIQHRRKDKMKKPLITQIQ